MRPSTLFLIVFLQLICLSRECPLGWLEHNFESNKLCYWIQAAASNLIWSDALWKCRERGGELFEPTDAMEMRWLEEQLSGQHKRAISSGVEWHVNAHRSLFSEHPAWRSGIPLNAFGNSVRESDDEAECTYSLPNDISHRIPLPFDCGLLRLDTESGEFHLSYTSCIRTRRNTGFVCKRSANPTHSNAAKPQNKQIGCGSEWTTPLNMKSEYVYSSTKLTANQSWFEAHQSCRAKGSELLSVESVEEARSIADQIDREERLSGAAVIGRAKFYVDLHQWYYRKDGWASPSGAALEASSVQWADGEPDRKCQQESCAYMFRRQESDEPRLSDTFCSVAQSRVWLVCQRLRSSCSLPIATSTPTAAGTASAKSTKAATTFASAPKFPYVIFGTELNWIVIAALASVAIAFAVFVLCLCILLCYVCSRYERSRSDRKVSYNRSQSQNSQENQYASLRLANVHESSNPRRTTSTPSPSPPPPPPPPPSLPTLPIVSAPLQRVSDSRAFIGYATVKGTRSNRAQDVNGPYSTLRHTSRQQRASASNQFNSTPQSVQQSFSQQIAGPNTNGFSEYLMLQSDQNERVRRVLLPVGVPFVPLSPPIASPVPDTPSAMLPLTERQIEANLQVLPPHERIRLELLDDQKSDLSNCSDRYWGVRGSALNNLNNPASTSTIV